MPGNLCACVQIETGHWVLLRSDCCHSRYGIPQRFKLAGYYDSSTDAFCPIRAIFDGLKDFGTFEHTGLDKFCLHTHVRAAKDTITRMRIMERDPETHIVLAQTSSEALQRQYPGNFPHVAR